MDYISIEELNEPTLDYNQSRDLYAWKKYMRELRKEKEKENEQD
jgi:hypothetical protein